MKKKNQMTVKTWGKTKKKSVVKKNQLREKRKNQRNPSSGKTLRNKKSINQ
jgi:hypothetical protein